MKLDHILKTINHIAYDNTEEVIVPTQHLIQLKAEILKLQRQLDTAERDRNRAVSEGLKILADQHFTPHFKEYA